jgi:hypothetical protein
LASPVLSMLLDEGRRFRVIVMCAWCEQEGRPAGLGERAPLDDQSKTHGICRHHAIDLLSRLPSRSFPGVRLLLVVNQEQAALYEFLERELAGVSGVRVMKERRRSDRRIAPTVVPAEKRRAERRVREGEVYSPGYTVIRFGGSS